MTDIKHTFRLLFFFWKSSLPVAIPVGLGFSLVLLPLLSLQEEVGVLDVLRHFLWYLPLGIFAYLLYKELSHKEVYYFYHNKGISRLQLWISSVLFSYSFWFVFIIVEWLWKNC